MVPRRLAALFVILFTALMGLWVDTVEMLDALERHVTCPVDGESVHAVSEGPQARAGEQERELRAAPPERHEAGCVFNEHGPSPSPILLRPPTVAEQSWVELPAVRAAAALDPPSASPLINAPKTSPPVG
jgi:hypothetical protein